MKTFCLNIIINSSLVETSIDYLLNIPIFKDNIKYYNIIAYNDLELDEYINFFNNKSISGTSINIKFYCWKEIYDKIQESLSSMLENTEFNIDDITNIFIDSDQYFTFNDDKLSNNIIDNTNYYINHLENNVSYNKLFISSNKDTYKPFLQYNLLDNTDFLDRYIVMDNCSSKTSCSRDKYKSLINNTDNISADNQYNEQYYYRLLFLHYLFADFDNVIYYFNKLNNLDSPIYKFHNNWTVIYMGLVGYYNNGNYKKTQNLAAKCLQQNTNRIEPLYILSKIAHNNNESEKANTLIQNLAGNLIKISTQYFCEVSIYNFYIHFHAIVLAKNNKNINAVTKLCIFLLNTSLNNTQYTIISSLLFNNIETNPTIVPTFLFNSKERFDYDNTMYFTNNSYHVKFNDKLYNISYTDTIKVTINIEETSPHNIEEFIIKDTENFENFSCINYKNNYILIINNTDTHNNIYKLNLETKEITKFLSYKLDDCYKNIKYVSKFICVENIYVGIISCYKKIKLYKFLFLDKSTLKPLYLSNLFKINNSNIIDIDLDSDLDNDNIIIFTDHSHNNTYTLSLDNLYFEFNSPFIYNENLKIDINSNIPINIETIGYELTTHTYKNFIISNDNPKLSVKYNFNHNLIKIHDPLINIKLNDFIFLPSNPSIQNKEYDIAYYDKDTIDDELIDNIEQKYKIGVDYKLAKYLIISNRDFEQLSMINLSNILENKTLIISLIEEEDLENSNFAKIYSNNKYLNKLFLFNIVKNKSYIDYLLDEVFDTEEYTKRTDFMNEDIENIYNNCNIFKHSFEIVKEVKSKLNSIETHFKKDEYKTHLLTKISQNTYDINILEIIKHILINNQDIDVFYNTDKLPDIIEKINMFSNPINIDEFNEIFEIGTVECILFVNNLDDAKIYDKICSKNSIVYILHEDMIYYT